MIEIISYINIFTFVNDNSNKQFHTCSQHVYNIALSTNNRKIHQQETTSKLRVVHLYHIQFMLYVRMAVLSIQGIKLKTI